MKTTWLLEKDLWKEENDQMREAIQSLGYSWRDVEYIPFSDQDFSQIQRQDERCIFYGSLGLAKKLRPYVQGVFCDLPKFECTNYYNYFGEYLLNSEYIMIPFGELKRKYKEIFNYFYPDYQGESSGLFIRPSSGFKLFTGQVIHYDTFDVDFKMLDFYDVDKNAIVCLSYPKQISKEWRVVVGEGKVITSSLYKVNDRIHSEYSEDQEVIDYVENLAKIWEPEPFWCADIGLCGNKLFLIEINAFSSSGLYACDKTKIVRSVSEYIQRINDESIGSV